MHVRGNIYSNLPDASIEESIQLLAGMPGAQVNIERIISEGQATPEGYWYEQPWYEWVLILRGGAEIEFASPVSKAVLAEGDWLLIPAKSRHRVAGTEMGTLWLAVHGDASTDTTLTKETLE